MAFNPNIVPGRPPLLWSDVHDAFVKVNENFDILVATVGGGSLVNFETLDTNLKPTTTNLYGLGDVSLQWKNLYVEEYSTVPGNELNGVWLGTAQIRGVDGTVELPANTTVNGNLIIDPAKTFFKTINVDNSNVIEATEFGSNVNFDSGTGISLAVDSGAETITITNSGVTQLVAGTAISVSGPTGNITVTNTGVTSVGNSTSLPPAATGRAAGSGIIASATSGGITLTNTGVISITGGSNITVSNDPATGDVTITNGAPATPGFQTFNVTGTVGQSSIVAFSTTDTFTMNAGYGMIVETNAPTRTMTLTIDQNIDINGSVFADDSTLMVDAVDNKIYASGGFFGDITGNVSATTLRTAEDTIALGEEAGQTSQAQGAIAIGHYAGRTSQSDDAISIGWGAGEVSQGQASVAIGYNAGTDTQGQGAVAIGADASNQNQGDYSIAIGNLAGGPAQGANSIAIGKNAGNGTTTANSIILNATGSVLTSAAAGFYVDPIRSTANGTPLMYDSSTKELFYSNVLEFTGSTISTSDSSAVQFNGPVTFQTTISTDQGIQLNGVDAIIRSDDNIRLVPTNSVESLGAELVIAGLDVMGEPYVIIETPTGQGTIQIGGDNNNTASVTVRKSTGEVYVGGFWRFLADGGLYSGYLSAPPDSPTAGAFYVADGATWDPASKSGAVPYPVFYDGASYHALY